MKAEGPYFGVLMLLIDLVDGLYIPWDFSFDFTGTPNRSLDLHFGPKRRKNSISGQNEGWRSLLWIVNVLIKFIGRLCIPS